MTNCHPIPSNQMGDAPNLTCLLERNNMKPRILGIPQGTPKKGR